MKKRWLAVPVAAALMVMTAPVVTILFMVVGPLTTAPPGAAAAIVPLTGPVDGIPAVMWDAYTRAAAKLTDDGCVGMRPQFLAGFAKVESDHGRFGGSVPQANGDVVPPILGPPLDGVSYALVTLPNGEMDRAGGPFQFITSTWGWPVGVNGWRGWGRDGNGDGVRDRQNAYDAALAAASMLCADARNDVEANFMAAAMAYNPSRAYALQVRGWIEHYDSLPTEAPGSGNALSGESVPRAGLDPVCGRATTQGGVFHAPPGETHPLMMAELARGVRARWGRGSSQMRALAARDADPDAARCSDHLWGGGLDIGGTWSPEMDEIAAWLRTYVGCERGRPLRLVMWQVAGHYDHIHASACPDVPVEEQAWFMAQACAGVTCDRTWWPWTQFDGPDPYFWSTR